MKLVQEVFGKTFLGLFKPLQSNQPLDVFKLIHGVLWIVVSWR